MLFRFANLRFVNLRTAGIVLIGVVMLFFFPAPRGSFVSTHGPMTSLASQCESLSALLALAFVPWRRRLMPGLIRLGQLCWIVSPELTHQYSPGFSILRI